MKAIIEIDESKSSSILSTISFIKSKKRVQWSDLNYSEQTKLLNSFSSYYDQFKKFVKSE